MERRERPKKQDLAYIQAWIDRATHAELRVCLALDGNKTMQQLIQEYVERYVACRRPHHRS